MSRSTAVLLAAASLSAHAQLLVCPTLQTTNYSDCLKSSRSTIDRRECVVMIESDLAEIDFWLQCELDLLDRKTAKDRQLLLDQAALRRKLLASRAASNAR